MSCSTIQHQSMKQIKTSTVMKKPRETDEEILDFFLHKFKCEPCKFPKGTCPDKSTCEGWHHEGERRRNPLTVSGLLYSEEPCPKLKMGGKWLKPINCENGDNCSFSHTMLEQMYHPNIFKTSLCTNFTTNDGDQCQWGYYCTHAHGQKDIRNPIKRNVVKKSINSENNVAEILNSCSFETFKDVPLINTTNDAHENLSSHHSSGNGSPLRSFATPSYQAHNDIHTPNSKYSPLPPSNPPTSSSLKPPHLLLPTATTSSSSSYCQSQIPTHSKTPNIVTDQSRYSSASQTFPNRLSNEKQQHHYSWGITLGNNNISNHMSNSQHTPPPPTTLGIKSYDSFQTNGSPSHSPYSHGYVTQTFTPSASTGTKSPSVKPNPKSRPFQMGTPTLNQLGCNQYMHYPQSSSHNTSKYMGFSQTQTANIPQNNLTEAFNMKILQPLQDDAPFEQQQSSSQQQPTLSQSHLQPQQPQSQILQTNIHDDTDKNPTNNSPIIINSKEASDNVSYYLFGDDSLSTTNLTKITNVAHTTENKQNDEILQLREQINELKNNLKLEKEKNRILLWETCQSHEGNSNFKNENEKTQQMKWLEQFMICPNCYSQNQSVRNIVLTPCGHLVCRECVPQKNQHCPICKQIVHENVQKLNL